ncbi:MAG: CDP-alcohol phosphatidyltransferase family protein [Candidatus Omnitrophica bacterium]|nr:CDP-alcohol phosphatidyltransferase family protein [Candidatus Omnitrophota bacterium]
MVESLKELNKKCQKPNYKTVGNWMVRHILRDAALPITWILLHFPVTANQVTVVSMLVAAVGGFLLMSADNVCFLAGIALLHIWYLLDHVDGQIARYRNTSSMEGRFFDYLMHHFVSFWIPFSTSVSLLRLGASVWWVVAGFIGSMSVVMIALISDAKSKTFYEYIMKDNATDNFANASDPDSVSDLYMKDRGQKSLPKTVFTVMYKSCEGHVILNVWLVLGVILIFVGSPYLKYIAVAYYALVSTLVWVVYSAKLILSGRITMEYEVNIKPRIKNG